MQRLQKRTKRRAIQSDTTSSLRCCHEDGGTYAVFEFLEEVRLNLILQFSLCCGCNVSLVKMSPVMATVLC
jgi:hypothetical protein